jgi:hypothetical protein
VLGVIEGSGWVTVIEKADQSEDDNESLWDRVVMPQGKNQPPICLDVLEFYQRYGGQKSDDGYCIPAACAGQQSQQKSSPSIGE